MNLLSRSRRRDPGTWTDDEVRSLVAAAYLGDYSEREPYLDMGLPERERSESSPGTGNWGWAAIVFHLPENRERSVAKAITRLLRLRPQSSRPRATRADDRF